MSEKWLELGGKPLEHKDDQAEKRACISPLGQFEAIDYSDEKKGEGASAFHNYGPSP